MKTPIDTAPVAHTPYDGSSKPFTIGLKPLDLGDWIEICDDLESYLAEKDRLEAAVPEAVFAAESGTNDAQREVLDLLAAYLPDRYPVFYSCDGATMRVAARTVRLDAAEPPLKTAARLIPDDLVVMRRSPEGWRLAAASLHFPSSWSLAEKFGRTLSDIHGPVPQFGAGTRNAELIERMFDRLHGKALMRMNWSLQPDRDLHKPLSMHGRVDRAELRPPRFPGTDAAAAAFIRVERQTLRKLPVSGDILFTIKIHLDPMAALRVHPDRKAVAASFAGQLDGLDSDQLDYKGLRADRDRLVAALREIAAA